VSEDLAVVSQRLAVASHCLTNHSQARSVATQSLWITSNCLSNHMQRLTIASQCLALATICLTVMSQGLMVGTQRLNSDVQRLRSISQPSRGSRTARETVARKRGQDEWDSAFEP
jgi:hypothetical protein